MNPVAFIYSAKYYADIGKHVFQIRKYEEIYERLRAAGYLGGAGVLEPQPVCAEDVLRVHTESYVRDLRGEKHTFRTVTSELPLSSDLVALHYLSTGGTLLAAQAALRSGAAVNLAGGFHHTFPDHAEGFCYLNDLAIAIRRLQADRRIERAAVVDLDLHQGNGTAFIFEADPSVFTFSMHQQDLYPVKQRSSLDIGLDRGVGDAEYLRLLMEHLPGILDTHRPQVVLYQAGVDPYEKDRLGDLRLTKDGLYQRDCHVVRECRRRSIPIAGVLGGGYAEDLEDTVDMHFNTCRAFLFTDVKGGTMETGGSGIRDMGV